MPGPDTIPRTRRRGLFAKYVMSLMGLVVFVLAVNGALEIWFSYRQTRAALIATMADKADATAKRIAQAMTDLERQIAWVTRASVPTLEQRRTDYAQLMREVATISQIVLIDAQGREALRLSRAGASNTDAFWREAYTAVSADRSTSFGKIGFRNSRPFITLAFAHAGRDAAVTVAEIDLQFLSTVIRDVQGDKAGAALVIDPAGRLIAHSAEAEPLGEDLGGRREIAALLRTPSQALTSGKDRDGNAVLVASRPVGRLGWYVLFEQPRSEALAPIGDVLLRIAGLIALGLIVAIVASTILARRMLGPIEALGAGASRLGAGDFDQRIAVKTGDEIEDLSDQFNSMAEQLRETYAGLESKVEARTRELERSIAELKVLEEVGRAVASSLDLQAVLPTVAARALEITRADAVLIFSYDAERRRFDLAEAKGIDAPAKDAPYASIDAGDSVLGDAARAGEPIVTADLAAAPDHPLKQLALAAGFAAVLVVPLLDQHGTLGSLVVLRRKAGSFSDSLIGLMRTFAHQSELAMRNARLFHEIERKGRELADAHAIVQRQAATLQEQTEQLLEWNKSLEDRVASQLAEIERIRRLERFLAPQVAQLIASSDGQEKLLDSHRREVTVVFCDLRGFTAFTEASEPEEAMNVLRDYHAALGELIFRYEGTLDRFAGDGVMILFNAPIALADHTRRAVKMAVEMRDALAQLTERWQHRGHSLGFGIGIAVGYATIGQVGFEKRLEYAAIGSVTNLASRLCAEAEPGQLVVSQRAYAMVEHDAEARPIAPLTLKGFGHPIPAVEILAWRETSSCSTDTNEMPAASLGAIGLRH